ncbi:endonuclease/exonuclease/phosphatase family protein [Pseudaminobacter salicylatoxidans]|uniref:endonuclease/exonuclease/phosphatase family protein n=1 Tax=Pseudaminobacter salicylatoxidans TaxID=93369 RepID=UPI00036ADDE6|nr:endonuclease/exonuclease/phosphatase family protein [Pseudaminobacter salicylatoxidans]
MNRTPLHDIGSLALLAALLLSLPLVAGFFGTLHPALDSLAHFRMHLAVLMVIAGLVLLARRFWLNGIVTVAFGVAALATVNSFMPILGPGRVHASLQPDETEQPIYKLLQINLRYNNPEPNKVLSLIGRIRPDVVTLDEVSEMWAGKLALLSSAYPHSIQCPYPNGVFGVAILSTRPFVEGREGRCHERGSFAVAPVDFGGRAVDVAALHLGWPWPFRQAGQIETLAGPLGGLGATALLAGDFNATPWSAAVARVAKLGGLTLAPSAGPTWQWHGLPEFLRFSGLPIDHVLHKGNVIAIAAHTLGEVGSDHLPVLVEFALKAAAFEPQEEGETSLAKLEHDRDR